MIPKADEIRNALATAQGIAWDTCHKIYILMDEAEVDKMKGYGYTYLWTKEQMDSDRLFHTISQWWRDSCGLRFIDICETPRTDDPNSGFYQVVPQGYQYAEELV